MTESNSASAIVVPSSLKSEIYQLLLKAEEEGNEEIQSNPEAVEDLKRQLIGDDQEIEVMIEIRGGAYDDAVLFSPMSSYRVGFSVILKDWDNIKSAGGEEASRMIEEYEGHPCSELILSGVRDYL